MPDLFDVFVSYNHQDSSLVENLAATLRAHGLRVFLDKWELRPSFPWQEGLEKAISASRGVAVCIGQNSLGVWQEPEMRAFIDRSRRETVPVIPVLLPGALDSPQLTLFLEAFTWVDLREGLTPEGLFRLIWGVTGKKPEESEFLQDFGRLSLALESRSGGAPRKPRPKPASASKTRRRWEWGIALGVLGLAATLAAWRWPTLFTGPRSPELYEVRVQVLDPEGHPLSGAKIRTSAGNEPHLLPDDFWEIQIPRAKVPQDGKITLWAEHEDWGGGQVNLTLKNDPNGTAQIHVQQPESWIRGRVVDDGNHSLAGVHITPQDGTPGSAISGADGSFEIKLKVPRERKVGLRAELPGFAPDTPFCYAGRDSCLIVLAKR